jgi:hypothetical protein
VKRENEGHKGKIEGMKGRKQRKERWCRWDEVAIMLISLHCTSTTIRILMEDQSES